jgi:hypothetical protein
LVHSKNGIIKFKPGLRTLLNLPKNSTVLTVFGDTILIERAIKIRSNKILRINHHSIQIDQTEIIGTTKSKRGTTAFNIGLKLKNK